MGYDLKAQMFVRTSTVSGDGSVAPALTAVGTVYLERVTVSHKQIVTAARDATTIEEVYRARYHSALVAGVWLRFDGIDREVVRCDPIARKRGFMLYLQRTPV